MKFTAALPPLLRVAMMVFSSTFLLMGNSQSEVHMPSYTIIQTKRRRFGNLFGGGRSPNEFVPSCGKQLTIAFLVLVDRLGVLEVPKFPSLTGTFESCLHVLHDCPMPPAYGSTFWNHLLFLFSLVLTLDSGLNMKNSFSHCRRIYLWWHVRSFRIGATKEYLSWAILGRLMLIVSS